MKSNWYKSALRVALGVVLIGAVMAPAMADQPYGRYGHDREWQDHVVRARHWHVIHPRPVPHVVYAPPPVIYTPPPPPPGINLIIPLNLR